MLHTPRKHFRMYGKRLNDTAGKELIMLTNKTYDILKWIALVVLPAAATFYTALAPIWGLPYETEIPMTITAVDALLGALLGVSSQKYKAQTDGTVD